MRDIVIFGASGHAKVVVDTIEKQSAFRIIVIFDIKPQGPRFFGYPVHAQSEFKALGIKEGLVAIGDNHLRRKVVKDILDEVPDFKFISAVHPSAILGRDVVIGDGTVVMAGCVINPDVKLGSHVVVNTGCNIDHDVRLSDFASVAPGCTLGGGVSIGESAFVGLGSSVIQQVKIGINVLIGAGSAVTEDISANQLAVGVPCKPIRARKSNESFLL